MKAFFVYLLAIPLFTCSTACAQSPSPASEEVLDWLRENAISLSGVEAERGFEDMQPLKKLIGDARIVALGEATHGTREFFQMKHRMLEFLVEEMGFNIFAIEATMPEGFDVNEYVLTGKGDPEKALAGLYFWTWNTEEVLEMIRWMRRYNADPTHSRKVKFYGFDMQSPTRPMKVLISYLNRVASETAGGLQEHRSLSILTNSYTTPDFRNLPKEDMTGALELLLVAIDELDTYKEQYVDQTGSIDWDVARLHANILVQNIRSNLPSENQWYRIGIRDSSMAANAVWIMEHEGPDAKMVTWAHNAHVSTREGWMGQHLRDVYGDDMIILGFAFNQGTFQAMEIPFNSGKGLIPFHVKPLDEGSLDATLSASGIAQGIIDLRMLPDSGIVYNWFSKPLKSRSHGAGYSRQMAGVAYDNWVTEFYDALLFIDETTAARPNPGGTRPGQRTLKQPENLDFENGDPGLAPTGWNSHKYRLANFDFTVETSNELPHQGEHCVKICRSSGHQYGETYGSLSQRLDATPYLGKRIRLRAAARTKLQGPGNHAYLWLTITKDGFGPQAQLFSDRMADRPIATNEWKFFEINGEVPKDAQWIDFGMALTGNGEAWFDSISIEEVTGDR